MVLSPPREGGGGGRGGGRTKKESGVRGGGGGGRTKKESGVHPPPRRRRSSSSSTPAGVFPLKHTVLSELITALLTTRPETAARQPHHLAAFCRRRRCHRRRRRHHLATPRAPWETAPCLTTAPRGALVVSGSAASSRRLVGPRVSTYQGLASPTADPAYPGLPWAQVSRLLPLVLCIQVSHWPHCLWSSHWFPARCDGPTVYPGLPLADFD